MGNLPNSKNSPLQLQQSAVFTPGATSFLNNQPAQGVKPKAYLNWVLFDEQFNFVHAGSGAELIGGDNAFTSHVKSNLPVNKNGYLYIYVSNATPNVDVFWDNLQVTHVRGALLEESHYYPFGLQMAGISSKSAGKLENRKKFNAGTELNNDFDISLYETQCRLYDPQLGRFWQVDELAEANWEWTPYNFSLNNPIRFNDPLGLKESDPNDPKVLPEVVVKSKRKLDHNQMQGLYWQLRESKLGFGAVKNDALRARLERWDGIQRFMENVHAQTRASDKIALEVGSWFIPVGWITKLKYVKYAANLFKLKRGVTIVAKSKALTTVLGKSGYKGVQGYEKVAAEMGYNSFQVSDDVWRAMSETERWAANSKFLAEVVARGDEIIFSKRVAAISGETGFFRKELEYLVEQGYQLAADGLGMIK